MKKVLFLLFLSTFVAAHAQLLFEVKSKNGQHTSYLFGTIHVMPEKQFVLPEVLLGAIHQSNMLAMEVDLNMDFATKLEVAKQSILPEGKSLQDYTSTDQYKKIQQYALDSCGIRRKKFKRFSRLKPFFLSSLMLQEQLDKTKSYEIEFAKIAKEQKKTTMGLESIQVQMETINTVSIADQVTMLMDMIEVPQSYEVMLTHYLDENLDQLYQDIVSESEAFPKFNEDFLEKRNNNWIPVMENQLEKENTFFAVGAGHLPGEKGVLNLLKLQGYTIIPIRLK